MNRFAPTAYGGRGLVTMEVICRANLDLRGAWVGNHPGLPGPWRPWTMDSARRYSKMAVAIAINASKAILSPNPTSTLVSSFILAP
jgi:hypothetical protein